MADIHGPEHEAELFGMTKWIGAMVLATGLLISAPITAAHAEDEPDCPSGQTPTEIPNQGWICVPVASPGNPGGEHTPGGGGGGPVRCRDQDGVEIPCTSDLGVWFAEHNCYANEAHLPAGAPEWGGHSPSEGSIWRCNNPLDEDPLYFFVPNGAAPALVDPAVLAQDALDAMKLATPNMHMAPAPPAQTYVGLETWLWMDQAQWNPLELTVTSGPTSVTVTAAPARAIWEFKDVRANRLAASANCASAGRAWVKGMTSSERTDCSVIFDQVTDGQPGDVFTVTSTIAYQVDWVCNGACLTPDGTLGEVTGLPGIAAISVGERQSVVIR